MLSHPYRVIYFQSLLLQNQHEVQQDLLQYIPLQTVYNTDEKVLFYRSFLHLVFWSHHSPQTKSPSPLQTELHAFWAAVLSKNSLICSFPASSLLLFSHSSVHASSMMFLTSELIFLSIISSELSSFSLLVLIHHANNLYHWLNKASFYTWLSSSTLLGCLALQPDPSDTLIQRGIQKFGEHHKNQLSYVFWWKVEKVKYPLLWAEIQGQCLYRA